MDIIFPHHLRTKISSLPSIYRLANCTICLPNGETVGVPHLAVDVTARSFLLVDSCVSTRKFCDLLAKYNDLAVKEASASWRCSHAIKQFNVLDLRSQQTMLHNSSYTSIKTSTVFLYCRDSRLLVSSNVNYDLLQHLLVSFSTSVCKRCHHLTYGYRGHKWFWQFLSCKYNVSRRYRSLHGAAYFKGRFWNHCSSNVFGPAHKFYWATAIKDSVLYQ